MTIKEQEIKKLGLKSSHIGSYLMRDAVSYAVAHPRARMTKDIYPALASAANMSAAAVERNLRFALRSTGSLETVGECVHRIAMTVRAYED